ncbi:hypothetical protein Sjap_006051 [Stephania japonica]|uniref:Uncharacterized protein n=1 Tax=Stephania japonica TaxID=461633 RepID=A0AAP0K6P7_9MAGN
MIIKQHHNMLFLLLLLLSLLSLHYVHAQPATKGYNCTTTTTFPCTTYLYYRPTPPNFLDLANISDMFNIGRPTIAQSSNLTSLSLSTPLSPDNSLFIPISCSCNTISNSTSYSYSNFTYKIKSGDTYYLISTRNFQNLTTYQAVEVVNPTLIAEDLTIGVDVIFPLFCKCPTEAQLRNGVRFLVTYVFQPNDNLSSVAQKFGADLGDVLSINGVNISDYETIFLPMSRLPNIFQPIVVPTNGSTNSGQNTTGVLNSSPNSDSRKRAVIGLGVGVGVLGVVLVGVVLAGVLCVCCRGGGRERERDEKVRRFDGGKREFSSAAAAAAAKEKMSLMADVSDCLDKYRVFGIEEVKGATGGFDSSCLIHGSVFKGFIGGECYAIKRMKWNAYEELKILQKVNHGNLVKLEGFSVDPDDGNCYLVYEYVENGSLDAWLHGDRPSKKKLDWKTRLRIAIDVANALQYIHEHTRPTVVHKDVKSSNILLDGNMRAKLANFGLARSGCNAITMHIVGTQGYIAPEYLIDGVVTTKMDVFAFGVVLLELISGREAIDEEGRVLWSDIDIVLNGTDGEKNEKVKGWMDETLLQEGLTIDGVMNVMAVALSCLQKDPSRRPNMVEVVYTLCKTNDLHSDFSEDGFSVTTVSAR